MARRKLDTSKLDTSCRASFRYQSRTVTVTMTDPFVPVGQIANSSIPCWWPAADPPVTRPTVVVGFICPATYVVDGLDSTMTFTTRVAIGSDGIALVVYDTVNVTMTPAVPAVDVTIPLAKIIQAAMRCSTARAIRFPVGKKYTFANVTDLTTWRLADDDSPKWIITDDANNAEPIHIGLLAAADEARLNVLAITGTGRRKRTEITDDLLRDVASVFTNAERNKREAVAKHFTISISSARERIRLARERGFLAKLPDRDGRTNRKQAK